MLFDLSQVPLCGQEHVPGELSDGDHIGGFLELQRLVICKRRLGVNDQVWVHRTVFILPIYLGALANARQAPISPSANTPKPTARSDLQVVLTCPALKLKLNGSGRKDRGGYDDSRYTDELVHSICCEISEL